jgi:hypothetical protein
MNHVAAFVALMLAVILYIDVLVFGAPNDERHDEQIESLQTQVAELKAK